MRGAILAMLLALIGMHGYAGNFELRIPTFGTYAYHHDLIRKSLEAMGHQVTIISLSEDYPQKRLVSMLDDDSMDLTLFWLVQTKERDSNYIPVNVGVTDGLIGQRILFIPKGKQAIYDGVKSLDDFRKLGVVGCFGKDWFDVAIWKANGLKVFEKDARWDPDLYIMLAQGGRDLDYFSRGAHEMIIEGPQHPELDIEKRLVLVYDRDLKYYLTRSNAKLKPVLEEALQKAKQSGLMAKLLRRHFSDVFDKDKINLGGRKVLRLAVPD